jgi:hypothetical protein
MYLEKWLQYIVESDFQCRGTRRRSWLNSYATTKKIVVSIPSGGGETVSWVRERTVLLEKKK